MDKTAVVSREKVKDMLITRTAIKTLAPESVVEKIVSFQGKDAAKFVRVHSEVEFSGFGKFVISQTKLRKRINGLETAIEKLSSRTDEKSLSKILSVQEAITTLKTKLKDGISKNSRGMEEQTHTPRTSEGTD